MWLLYTKLIDKTVTAIVIYKKKLTAPHGMVSVGEFGFVNSEQQQKAEIFIQYKYPIYVIVCITLPSVVAIEKDKHNQLNVLQSSFSVEKTTLKLVQDGHK